MNGINESLYEIIAHANVPRTLSELADLSGMDYARAVAEAAGLPLKMTCADERLCGELEGRIDPLFPLAIQKLYYMLEND